MYSKFGASIVILLSVIPFCRLDFVEDLIQAGHFPSEKHMVRTEDGYILSVYRIPATHSKRNNGKVVLLVHPMTCSASSFLMFGRKAAAFYFANSGYDVWIPSNRGTRFSREHETLSPDDEQFWNFSWHEIGLYDLPAIIDFILKRTNVKKLSYVGHSQSVTALLVMLAELPHYNEKISVAHLMTPTFMFKYSHPAVVAFRLNDTIHDIEKLFRSLRLYEIISFTPLYRGVISLLEKYCMTDIGKTNFLSLMTLINGSAKYYYDGILTDIKEHIPGGLSYKQVIHYFQNFAARSFQKYHHGEKKNMIIYGSAEPPLYNMSNVKANIHMMYGTDDVITPATNIQPLNDVLGRKIAVLSKFDGYGHIEFGYAKLDMVYGRILKIDKKFN